MVDFSELPKDGILFEQLARELLMRSGFDVHWTGVGPDGQKDLIIVERSEGALSSFERRWLVNCKHNAVSGASVGLNDLPNIIDACASVKADGFLLVCSTQPTSAVVTRLEELERSGRVRTRIWDGIELKEVAYALGAPASSYIFTTQLLKDWLDYLQCTVSVSLGGQFQGLLCLSEFTDCKSIP